MRAVSLLIAILALAPLAGLANATYNVTGINVNIYLNTNTSAHISETIELAISNQSITQYQTNRVALNLTLSQWQQLVGSQLTEHVINPRGSAYNFVLLPGPVIPSGNTYKADIILSYDVHNVTVVNQTSPRVFVYTMKSNDFNFQHGASGQVLGPHTVLNITVPQGSQIKSIYPLPDYPTYGITNNYTNVTTLSWFYGEPLSKFSLVFAVNQSIRDEVSGFFSKVYHVLGIYSYLLIAAVIALFVLYVYYRASR